MAKKLSEKVIRSWCGDANYIKGKPYAEKSLFDLFKVEETIQGRCQGRSSSDYRVEVRLDEGEIHEASCSCPVGGSGQCKHVAALLMRWQNAPQDFAKREPFESRMKDFSREDLLLLIQQMIRQKPDLELLLDTPLPGMKTQKEVTAEVYQKQAQAMFHRYDTLDWEDVRLLASDLSELLSIGNEFLNEKQVARAMPVFLGMLHCFGEYLHHWDELTEPLFSLRGECIKALLASLPLLSETDPIRETILLPLFEVMGEEEFEVAGDSVFEYLATDGLPSDRKRFLDWVAETPARQKTFAEMVLSFTADEMDDDSYLAYCRKNTLTLDLIERLIDLQRFTEVETECQVLDGYQLRGVLDALVKAKKGELAEKIAKQRLKKEKDHHLIHLETWLSARYVATKKPELALSFLMKHLLHSPSFENYQAVKKIYPTEEWPQKREEILKKFADKKHHYFLIQLYLEEQNIEALLKLPEESWSYYRPRIAELCEETHPEVSLRIHQKRILDLVASGGRGNYEAACPFIATCRKLYVKAKDLPTYKQFVEKLILDNPRLRNLKEALLKSKLVDATMKPL